MKWIRKHRPSPATAIALAALIVALGGAAFAAIPDSNGTIHGCYQKQNGSLRVVQSESNCKSSELAIQWNQTGPPGPPGSGGGQTAAFAEASGEVTTQSSTPVDLGGPSVSVTVPASGLIGVFARAELSSDGGIAEISLFEPADFSPPVTILGACCSGAPRQWTTPTNVFGTAHRLEAGWLLLEATPGTRTYTLEYRNSQAG
jgi:hypothetical protein